LDIGSDATPCGFKALDLGAGARLDVAIIPIWEEFGMRSFLVSCAAIVVIALGAVLVLNHVQQPVETAFTSPTGVRI
jgi:hypothetical protein